MNRRDLDPFAGMMSLREAMSRLLEDSVVASSLLSPGAAAAMPVDLAETRDALILRASLPGVHPDDIDITVTGGTVTIRGEMRDNAPEGEVRHHYREHRYGVMSRTMSLPVEVQPDKVEASFEHGVLTLTMPKAERLQPKSIKITTRGAATPIEAQAGTKTERIQIGESAETPSASAGNGQTAKAESGNAGAAKTRTRRKSAQAAGPDDSSV